MSNEEIKKYIERIELKSDFFSIDGVNYNREGNYDFDDLWNMKIYLEYLNLYLDGKIGFNFWAYNARYSDSIISDMSKDEDLINIFTDKIFEKLVTIINKFKSNG